MSKFSLPLVIAFVATLSASPVVAQGNGNGHGRGSDKKELRDNRDNRDRDDDDDDRPRFERRRTDDRRSPQRSTSRATQQRRVPPGWCQGRGNPHNTPENCRYNSRSREWERFDTRSGRWEDRDGYERNESRYGDRGSYDQAHRDFHYNHDRRCRERAAQRPLDLRWQVQVRSECKATHDEFHRRWGTPHR
jgi:hypothetical protein